MSSGKSLRRRFHCLATAVLCSGGVALGEKVSTDLPIAPASGANSLRMTITATVTGLGTSSDTKTSTITGNLLSDMVILFDPLTNGVSNIHSLELTGGQMTASDVTLKLSWLFGLASVELAAKGVGGTFDTPVPPGMVIGGVFDASQHQVLLNKGTLVATGKGLAAGLLPENPYTVDLAAQPIPATSSGAGAITIGSPSLVGDTLSYALSVQMPVAFDQTVYDEPGTATVRAAGSGTMKAAGTLTRKLPVNVPTWNIDGGGSWLNVTSWKSGTIPNAAGATAWLLDKVTALNSPATVTVSGLVTVGTLVFENANRYTIAKAGSGLLRLNNSGEGAVVHAIRGSHVIGVPIQAIDGCVIDVGAGAELQVTGGLSLGAGKNLSKRGGGVATIDGGMVLSASSSLDVIEGVLNFERIENGALNIGEHAAASLDPGATSAKASLVHTLRIAGARDAWLTSLDLNRGQLIVQTNAQSPADVLAEISNQIASARNTATPWTGKGITSSAARAQGGSMTGIGVIGNGLGGGAAVYDVFGGQAVNDNSVLLKYTWNGDANLDGVVNADDYFLTDSGYITQIGGWYNGDFNYDGWVNADDYFLIDSAFIGQTGALLRSKATMVPEPAGLLGLLGSLLLVRRRRRR